MHRDAGSEDAGHAFIKTRRPCIHKDTERRSSLTIPPVSRRPRLVRSAAALLSSWISPGTPLAREGRKWVTTHPSTDIPFPTADMQICIKTDHGRYGLLHVDSLSGPGND